MYVQSLISRLIPVVMLAGALNYVFYYRRLREATTNDEIRDYYTLNLIFAGIFAILLVDHIIVLELRLYREGRRRIRDDLFTRIPSFAGFSDVIDNWKGGPPAF